MGSMTTAFLATGPSGLARAELAQGHVEHVAAGFDVRCVAADPRAAQNIYAGTQGDGVLRSDDAGRTWRRSRLGDVSSRVLRTILELSCELGQGTLNVAIRSRVGRLIVRRVTWSSCDRLDVNNFTTAAEGCRQGDPQGSLRGR